MGLAASTLILPADNYALTYFAPQPRAFIRVVNPDNPNELVPYDTYGRVELTTMTREFFLPRFLERDAARRVKPRDQYGHDGLQNVKPFVRPGEEPLTAGVY